MDSPSKAEEITKVIEMNWRYFISCFMGIFLDEYPRENRALLTHQSKATKVPLLSFKTFSFL
jgi:hypothetical protein